MLLLFNDRLCKSNPAMQLAYATLASNAAHRAQLLLGRIFCLHSYQTFSAYYAAGRSCAGAVLAAPHAAREAVRQACIAATKSAGPAAAAAAAAEATPAAAGAEAAAHHGVQLCLQYQPLRCGGVHRRQQETLGPLPVWPRLCCLHRLARLFPPRAQHRMTCCPSHPPLPAHSLLLFGFLLPTAVLRYIEQRSRALFANQLRVAAAHEA